MIVSHEFSSFFLSNPSIDFNRPSSSNEHLLFPRKDISKILFYLIFFFFSERRILRIKSSNNILFKMEMKRPSRDKIDFSP